MAVRAVFGGELAWVADNDAGAARILAHHYPGTRNLGDLTCVDWAQVAPVDVVCGGYPCQPFSSAGRRKGVEDERHIWPHIARALRVLRPRYAVFENVANHLRLGFDTVLSDLAHLGFDAEWCVVRADNVGAPHRRRRLVVVAVAQDTDGKPGQQRGQSTPRQAPKRGAWTDARGRGGAPASYPSRPGLALGQVEPDGTQRPAAERNDRQPAGRRWGAFAPAIARWEAATGRRAPGPTDARGQLSPLFVEWMMGLPAGHVTDVPGLSRTAQLTALGNGVVPQQATAALRHLMERTRTGEGAAA
nr:DNA cytosine methyltransferase [Streptomyces cacaoi]